MAAKPTVSIIIPTLNGRSLLAACLRSLAIHIKIPHEIIVVDNHSGDKTAEYLARAHPEVRTIELKKNEGFCRPNNLGAHAARGAYILFLNNDTLAHNDFITPLVRYMRSHPDVGLMQPKLYLNWNKKILDSTGSFFSRTGFLMHRGYREIDRGQFDAIDSIFGPKGAAMIMPTALFKKIGGFDEMFFAYNEETDLAWRVWLAGKKVQFFPIATLEHVGGSTEKIINFNYIQFHSFKNRIRMLIKNLELPGLLAVLPLHLILTCGLALMLLVLGRVRKSITIGRTVQWNLLHIGDTLKARGRIRTLRVRRDHQILPPLTRRPETRRSLISIAWFIDRKGWDQR